MLSFVLIVSFVNYENHCLYFSPQHVDDHSIIMADQTVIKKGESSSYLYFI